MNTKSEYNLNYKDYLKYIVQSLHMEVGSFMDALVSTEHGCYERIIYKWVLKLFQKDKTMDHTLDIIFRARSLFLLRTAHITPAPSEPTENLQNLLTFMLESTLKYKKLSIKDQHIVQEKIARLTKMNNAKEIVKQVLESIDPVLEIEKINKTLIMNKMTLDRIKEDIRKVNLENYRNNKHLGKDAD